MLQYASIAIQPTRQDIPNVPRDSRWISVSDAAAILGVDPATVWRWQKAGDLTAIKTYKPGRHTLYWRPDVEAWVKARGGHIDTDTTK